jgi:nitroreductase
MQKRAQTAFPVHDLIAERWSPLAFDGRAVDAEMLGSLFEAARWAPSCFNEQPWYFLVATREQPKEFERLAACLVEGNAWARQAPVLVLSVAKLAFERNGKPNRHAYHDVGLAAATLVLQAQSMGLVTHQMGGFDVEKARADLSIPDGCDPVAMIAIGHHGDTDSLPEGLAVRERSDRARKVQESFVFGAGWETAPPVRSRA